MCATVSGSASEGRWTKLAWHKRRYQQTGTAQGLGVELGCQKHCSYVARSQPHLQASEGIPPLPGHSQTLDITRLPPLLQACGWRGELPAGNISGGILWQTPFPKALGLFSTGAHPLHQ